MDNSEQVYEMKEQKDQVITFPISTSLLDFHKDNITLDNIYTKSSKEEILNRGFRLHSNGNLKEAEKWYKYFLDKGFYDPRVLSNYGIICKQNGKIKTAIRLFEKSIDLFPSQIEAYYNLGNLLREIGKPLDAEFYTRKCILINPKFVHSYSNLGNILKDLKRFKDAEFFFRKAIEIDPSFALAYSNLGSLYSVIGQLKQAEIYFRKSIEIDPKAPESYSNLSSVLKELGKFDAAEAAILQAIKLSPENNQFKSNLIELLTMYNSRNINLSPLIKINDEFRNLNLINYKSISDNHIVNLYREGFKIFKKYDLKLKTPSSQIMKTNEINLNCKRHMFVFDEYKIIPEFCFGCYKVLIEPTSIIDLLKLFFLFSNIKFKNNNIRKCMIEMRPNISGLYKGFIYCRGLEDAYDVSNIINLKIKDNISHSLVSTIKRGCSEYSIEFPEYKKIRNSTLQPMNYNNDWRKIEYDFDQVNNSWPDVSTNIDGFNLNSFLVIRNWIAYAQKVGDKTADKITNEIISLPKSFINIDINSRKIKNI